MEAYGYRGPDHGYGYDEPDHQIKLYGYGGPDHPYGYDEPDRLNTTQLLSVYMVIVSLITLMVMVSLITLIPITIAVQPLTTSKLHPAPTPQMNTVTKLSKPSK